MHFARPDHWIDSRGLIRLISQRLTTSGRCYHMKASFTLRAMLIALTACVGSMLSSASHAESGTVTLTIYKAGWIIGGSGGTGVLNFRGRSYALTTGGLDYGFV